MVFYQDFLGVVALVSFSNNFTILYYAVRFVHSTLLDGTYAYIFDTLI
jgi:hypothetical protein